MTKITLTKLIRANTIPGFKKTEESRPKDIIVSYDSATPSTFITCMFCKLPMVVSQGQVKNFHKGCRTEGRKLK